MTTDEASKIAKILATADGDCEYCTQELCKLMKHEFQEFDWFTLAGVSNPEVESS